MVLKNVSYILFSFFQKKKIEYRYNHHSLNVQMHFVSNVNISNCSDKRLGTQYNESENI